MKTQEERLAHVVEGLRSALGPILDAVVLYGSAARGDHAGRSSDLNLLVVVTDEAPDRLEPAAPVQRHWQKEGNPPFLFVTAEWIRNSTDVFPLEFMDMLAAHRVLHGRDILAGIQVVPGNLRHQCEHELRSLVLKLRAAYLDAHGRATELQELITASFGSVMAIARASLRLAGSESPLLSEDVVDAAALSFHLDGGALRAALAIKKGRKVKDVAEVRRIFLDYFDQIAALSRALDSITSTPPGAAAQERRA